MAEKLDLERLTLDGKASVTVTSPEHDEERRSRLKRDEWDALSGYLFKAVVIILFVVAFGVCAWHLASPDVELAKWARAGFFTLLTALAGYVAGRAAK